MCFRHGTQVGQLGSYVGRFFRLGQDAYRRFASIQLTIDPGQVVFGKPQPLMEEGTQNTADHRAAQHRHTAG